MTIPTITTKPFPATTPNYLSATIHVGPHFRDMNSKQSCCQKFVSDSALKLSRPYIQPVLTHSQPQRHGDKRPCLTQRSAQDPAAPRPLTAWSSPRQPIQGRGQAWKEGQQHELACPARTCPGNQSSNLRFNQGPLVESHEIKLNQMGQNTFRATPLDLQIEFINVCILLIS